MSDSVVPGDLIEMAMFPLGSTVFPSQIIPLHVFEPRYRQLFADLGDLGPDSSFGIALIDRGHEVGGGDSRVSVATRVEILQAERFEDGRWAVVAVGVERLDVHEWLEDEPYPRAMVSTRTVIDNGGSSLDDLEELLLETISATAASGGYAFDRELEFSPDPLQKLDQFSAVSPLVEFDRQRVLEANKTSEQIERLTEALTGRLQVLRADDH